MRNCKQNIDCITIGAEMRMKIVYNMSFRVIVVLVYIKKAQAFTRRACKERNCAIIAVKIYYSSPWKRCCKMHLHISEILTGYIFLYCRTFDLNNYSLVLKLICIDYLNQHSIYQVCLVGLN